MCPSTASLWQNPPGFRTLSGLVKPYIILISSLNPGEGTFGGGDTIVIPYSGYIGIMEKKMETIRVMRIL